MKKINYLIIILLATAALAGLFLLLRQKNIQEPLSVIPTNYPDKYGTDELKRITNSATTTSPTNGELNQITNKEQSIKEKEEEPFNDPTKISPISGLSCANYNRRPIAVMLAGDTVTRPLSGFSAADMVFEMQVVTDSVTRLMAVFVCNSPKEIGSVRSARHDFIPLAMGIDAIFAHWGGSHYALDDLNGRIMNNIDALKNPFNAFYRKSGIAAPHNGFTSTTRLFNSATKLKYRLTNNFEGYPHESQITNNKSQITNTKIKINYTYPFNTEWQYNADTNLYARWRGGKKEIDKNNGKQITAANVVVMRADSRTIEGQYNDVDVEGEGRIEVYQNGGKIEGIWKKDKANLKNKLYFLDSNSEEVKFVPGQIWVEIIEPNK